MVVSGGKSFVPIVKDMGPDYKKEDSKGEPLDKVGVLVVWEAFEAKTMRQMKLVEEHSPECFDNHETLGRMVHDGEFRDGTHINKVTGKTPDTVSSIDITPYPPDLDAQPSLDPLPTFFPDQITECSKPPLTGNPSKEMKEEEGHTTGSKVQKRTPILIVTTTHPYTEEREMFEIELPGPDPDSTQVVYMACPKPPQLNVLLSDLQVNTSLSESDCRLEFQRRPGEVIALHSQEELESYLSLPNRPKLYVARKD